MGSVLIRCVHDRPASDKAESPPPNIARRTAHGINPSVPKIVRTPGVQPATVHPTRSFAIMHAAIYDAVNAIDATHKPYLVDVERVSPHAFALERANQFRLGPPPALTSGQYTAAFKATEAMIVRSWPRASELN
jgi:hypothetical protein